MSTPDAQAPSEGTPTSSLPSPWGQPQLVQPGMQPPAGAVPPSSPPPPSGAPAPTTPPTVAQRATPPLAPPAQGAPPAPNATPPPAPGAAGSGGSQAPAWPAAATLAQHGGVIALPQVLYAEVLPQPDGRITVFVRDARRAPVAAHEVRLMLRRGDGSTDAVALGYDPAQRAYTGRVAGVPAGAYILEVGVKPAPHAPPAHLVTPPVVLHAAQTPPPRHGGSVQMVGDYAVEAVVDPSGQVSLFWTDAQGNPLDAAQVAAQVVTITANGRSVTAPLAPAGDRHIARVPARIPPHGLTVTVPAAQLGATRFHNIVARATPVPAGGVQPAQQHPGMYGGGPPHREMPEPGGGPLFDDEDDGLDEP